MIAYIEISSIMCKFSSTDDIITLTTTNIMSDIVVSTAHRKILKTECLGSRLACYRVKSLNPSIPKCNFWPFLCFSQSKFFHYGSSKMCFPWRFLSKCDTFLLLKDRFRRNNFLKSTIVRPRKWIVLDLITSEHKSWCVSVLRWFHWLRCMFRTKEPLKRC